MEGIYANRLFKRNSYQATYNRRVLNIFQKELL